MNKKGGVAIAAIQNMPRAWQLRIDRSDILETSCHELVKVGTCAQVVHLEVPKLAAEVFGEYWGLSSNQAGRRDNSAIIAHVESGGIGWVKGQSMVVVVDLCLRIGI